MSVIVETSLGEFTIDLYCKERPKCCENFLKLCKLKYYNYSLFHSIQTRLVAQTGDPSGTGSGGYSVWKQLNGQKYFMNELKPKIKHRKAGLVSMVNNGQNEHGSQFFITLADDLDYLNGIHTVFGEISEGIEIVDKLNRVFIDKSNRPLRDVRIYHTIILDDPFPDSNLLKIPEMSPEPTDDQLVSDRIGAEERIDDDYLLTEEEKREIERVKEAKTNAQILTVIGDIPDEDVKPPDNVLFVCALNPITTGEDLEVIFSRFGEILSCEVIRDYKTGNSLQYAFIEFENKKSCEEAYYSMERVLIDDRRIHVDFSQSVAKKWRSYREDLQRRMKNTRESRKDRSKSKDKKRNKSKDRHRDRSRERTKKSERRPDRSRREESRDRKHHRDRSRSKGKSHRKSDDRKRSNKTERR